MIGKRNKILISQEGTETDEKNDEKQWEGNSVEANPACFHGGDLTVTGKHAEGEKRSEQNSIGKGPLKNYFRKLIEEIEKDKVKRGLVFDEEIHLLQEKDDHINEDQTGQAQAEDLQEFPDDISMKDAVTFKHLQKTPSTSAE
jgi:hypothetical protein